MDATKAAAFSMAEGGGKGFGACEFSLDPEFPGTAIPESP